MTLQNNIQTSATQYNVQCNSGWGWQRIVLLIIILQSIGIRFLPMQGALASVVICLILAQRINIPIRQLLFFLIFGGIIVFLSARINSDFKLLFYIVQIIFVSFIFNRYVDTRWPKVEYDLLVITWWLSLHGLSSFLIFKILPNIYRIITLGQLKYYFFGPFVLSAWEPIRATGLCWEPGLLQYVANLSLFFGIKHSWPRWKLAVSFLSVVATFSTTGIFVLAITISYLLVARRRSMSQWISIGFTMAIIVVLGMTVFQTNITDKLGGSNLSGLARLRDLNVGLELIKDKPFFGHGLFDEKYLVSKSKIYEIATELFSKEHLAISGDMASGYTNGFLSFLASYGLLVGVFVYWCFYNNRLIQGGVKERITFFLISILTFISEPITNTSWFFALAISGIYSSQLRERIKAIHKKLMPQKNSMAVPE